MTHLPIVSVIVPCRNEARFIADCLLSVLLGDYPAERLEVIVADGMSTDGTREIIEEMTTRHPQLLMVDNPRYITPAALNIALARSKGDVVIRMDAHAAFPRDYVATCVDYLQRTGADVVGGPIDTRPGVQTLIARAIALVLSTPFGVSNSRFRTSQAEGRTDTVPFGAYRREIFDRVGTFDERLPRNQDNELSSRIIAGGGAIYITPALTATYFSPSTLSGFLRQAVRTGWWNVATIRVNVRAFRWRHFVPGLFVAGVITLSLTWPLSPIVRAAALVCSATYVTLAVGSAIMIARRAGVEYALILPPLFLALHVSYGLGILGGIGRQFVKTGEQI